MEYNFKGLSKIHIFMDERNERMAYECYSNDRLLDSGFFGRNLRPIEMYNFLTAVSDSGAILVVGDEENNLEGVLNRDSIFFQN